MADLMFVLASGEKIDKDRAERFAAQVDSVYENPFKKKTRKKMTAAEIKQHIIDKIDDLLKSEEQHGSDDAGGKADAG